MRLQQSRSAAVIAAAGMTQAIIGVASRTSDKTETATLQTGLIALGKYRFTYRLDAILPGKLQVTDDHHADGPLSHAFVGGPRVILLARNQ